MGGVGREELLDGLHQQGKRAICFVQTTRRAGEHGVFVEFGRRGIGEDDDGHVLQVGVRAHVLEHARPAQLRQDQVQDDQVNGELQQGPEGGQSV